VRVLALALAGLALAGCGSQAVAELPAPAGPPPSPPLTEPPAGTADNSAYTLFETASRGCRDAVASAELDEGKRLAVLCGRERALKIYDAKTHELLASTGAGIGPTDVATDGHQLLYVTDTAGQALLVFHLRPFELIRRVHLGAAPYAIAYDPGRWGLWIALPGANRLDYYAAGNRPVIREAFPTIRNVRHVLMDGDEVNVIGERQVQVLRPRSR
jgi:hypothetical protein